MIYGYIVKNDEPVSITPDWKEVKEALTFNSEILNIGGQMETEARAVFHRINTFIVHIRDDYHPLSKGILPEAPRLGWRLRFLRPPTRLLNHDRLGRHNQRPTLRLPL